MRICLAGDPEDLSLSYLGWLAKNRGADVLMLPEAEFGLRWSFSLPGNGGRDEIHFGERRYALKSIDGAIVRFNPKPKVLAELGIPEEHEHIYVLERRYALYWLLDNAPFHVVNRPYSGRSNSAKPYQMKMLEKFGFRVPKWIATNDVDRILKFMESCQDHKAIYKSCSGLRSHVQLVDDALIDRIKQGTTPLLIQEYIPGSEVRVHVVGERVFVTRINSHAVDYRFDTDAVEYSKAEMPPDLTGHCICATKHEKLSLSGIDFRVSPSGSWYCLEINPVPTFLPYEAATGQPMGDAILNLFGKLPNDGQAISPLFKFSNNNAAMEYMVS